MYHVIFISNTYLKDIPFDPTQFMEQDFDHAIRHMGRAATLAVRARAPRLLEAACVAVYNFGRVYDHVVGGSLQQKQATQPNSGRLQSANPPPPLKCDVTPFAVACDCYLDSLEGGWWKGEIDEKHFEEKEKGILTEEEKERERERGKGKIVEEWLRDFVCFTLEGLAGEHEFEKLVELGERFNRLTNNIYAGILYLIESYTLKHFYYFFKIVFYLL